MEAWPECNGGMAKRVMGYEKRCNGRKVSGVNSQGGWVGTAEMVYSHVYLIREVKCKNIVLICECK